MCAVGLSLPEDMTGAPPLPLQVIPNIVSVLDSYGDPAACIADFVQAFETEAFDERHIAAQQPMVRERDWEGEQAAHEGSVAQAVCEALGEEQSLRV